MSNSSIWNHTRKLQLTSCIHLPGVQCVNFSTEMSAQLRKSCHGCNVNVWALQIDQKIEWCRNAPWSTICKLHDVIFSIYVQLYSKPLDVFNDIASSEYLPSYPEIDDATLKCSFWTFKKWLDLKCGIAIVLLTCSHKVY